MDKSHVDILQIANQYTKLKRTASYNGGQFSGACPLCNQGTDRFQVWAGKQTFWCRQCRASGDVIELVMKCENVDFKTACDKLGIQLDDQRTPTAPKMDAKPYVPPHPLEELQPLDRTVPAFTQAWQDAATRFIEQSNQRLEHDDRAMAYLNNKRHISSYMALSSRLGFNPTPRYERWGDVDVFLPRGIVIPWTSSRYTGADTYFTSRIRFRPLDDNYQQTTLKNGTKYPQVAGALNGLYFDNIWDWMVGEPILPTQVIVLCEGEFDALAFNTNKRFAGVQAWATGGTTQARAKEWVNLLSKARKVLLAFDAGETAGPMACVWWSSVLPNTQRLQPTRHDITDMITDGVNLDDWIRTAKVMEARYYIPTPEERLQQTSFLPSDTNNHYTRG